MLLPDVNVLVCAHRADAAGHLQYREWLERVLATEPAFGMAELVLSGFVRVVTHPKVFREPSPLDTALEFAETLRNHSHCILVAPGAQHWEIFARLCRAAGTKGNLVPDAYLAALAIESGAEWITTDRDYARFPGLRFRHPFDSVR